MEVEDPVPGISFNQVIHWIKLKRHKVARTDYIKGDSIYVSIWVVVLTGHKPYLELSEHKESTLDKAIKL